MENNWLRQPRTWVELFALFNLGGLVPDEIGVRARLRNDRVFRRHQLLLFNSDVAAARMSL